MSGVVKRQRGLTVVLVSAMMVGLFFPVAGGSSASAAQAEREAVSVNYATIEKAQLQKATKSAAALPSSDDRARRYVDKYLESQAKIGRFLDKTQVHIATLSNPLIRDTHLTVAWDGKRTPLGISLGRVKGDTGGKYGVGVIFANDTTEAAATSFGFGGAGYDSALSAENMTEKSNNCASVYYTPDYPSVNGADHQLITCYEKFFQPNTQHWIYNRWSLWTPAEASGGPLGYNSRTTDFTIRSRPWRGYESRLVKLNKWAPLAPNSDCADAGNLTIGGTYFGITGQITFPVHKCENTELRITPETREIGIDFTGEKTGQMALDVAGDFDAARVYNPGDATTEPVFADYNWTEVTYCTTSDFGCVEKRQQLLNKDAGW